MTLRDVTQIARIARASVVVNLLHQQPNMFDPRVTDAAPILIVDDEEDLVATYERILRRKGYPVISAHNLNDGLAVIERGPLKLLVTDVRLPDGNGLDLVRAGRQQPHPIPALVVTGSASEAGRRAALDVSPEQI